MMMMMMMMILMMMSTTMTNVIIIVILMRRLAAATHFPCAGAGIDLTLIRAPGSDHWEARFHTRAGRTYLWVNEITSSLRANPGNHS